MTGSIWASLFLSMAGVSLLAASPGASKTLLRSLGVAAFCAALGATVATSGAVVGSILFVVAVLAASSLLVLILPPRPGWALPWAYGSALIGVCLCLYAFSRSVGGAP